ncbi:MAG: protoporphyrinogen oxidase [Deltaproteobacteria bacterium]|nr:protoporphyrinogen oxidase [Deltaproteobacteria bacterium]
MSETDILIIGGGIAGLTAAWTCRQAGRDVRLLEAKESAGGVIRSVRDGPYLKETGPNAFLGDAEELLALARAVGIEEEIVEPPKTAAARFIYWRGELHLVPRGPREFAASKLLSWRGKCRLLGEWFVRSGSVPDETVAAFVRRRLGTEALERLVDPLVAGIFAGDPERLSLAAAFPKMAALESRYGGLIRGAFKMRRGWQARGVHGFRNGMETLPSAIAQKLGDALVTKTAVTAISRLSDGSFQVTVGRGDTVDQWRARVLILATPAYVTAGLLAGVAAQAVAPLRAIPYAPIVVAHVAIPLRDCQADFQGFGFLVPRRSAVRCLGVLWTSSCFPGRAPAGHLFATCFYGGERDREATLLGESALREVLAYDLRQTMGIKTAPEYLSITRHKAGIPQYTIGHQERIAQIASAVGEVPGLYLTGNYLTGTSVADTIAHATRAAHFLLGTTR